MNCDNSKLQELKKEIDLLVITLQENDKKHDIEIQELKHGFTRQQHLLKKQQKILSFATSLGMAALMLYFTANTSNINPQLKSTLEQILIVVLTGAGSAAAMATNSGLSNEDDDDIT